MLEGAIAEAAESTSLQAVAVERRGRRHNARAVKDLRGSARTASRAPRERWFDLARAVESYPDWYPEGVREVEVLEEGGDGPVRVRARLYASVGPISRDFELEMHVEARAPDRVRLSRVTTDPSQQTFEVTWSFAEAAATDVEILLEASLNVPRLLPVDGLGDQMARGFIDAASRKLKAP